MKGDPQFAQLGSRRAAHHEGRPSDKDHPTTNDPIQETPIEKLKRAAKEVEESASPGVLEDTGQLSHALVGLATPLTGQFQNCDDDPKEETVQCDDGRGKIKTGKETGKLIDVGTNHGQSTDKGQDTVRQWSADMEIMELLW
mmetsp:Transcript_16602/g.38132  ORF Transcript_16602/g.38132 Transcript_16602/m.38132 type:complete len:142 (+) Transcript_16602:1305-1730(+)